MKKSFSKFTSLIVIFASLYLFIKAKVDNHIVNQGISFCALDSNHKLQPALIELFKELNISHDNTLSNIVSITQKEWLRKSGKERWEIGEVNVSNKEKILNLIDKIGFVQEKKPTSKNYDYALMMGALSTRMKLRLAYLMDLFKKGIRFRNLVFLVGARPRDEQQETPNAFLLNNNDNLAIKKDWKLNKTPSTEAELAKIIFYQIELSDDFKNSVNVIFVDTPMQKTETGLCRPNTADTINEWMKLNPQQGSCLVISNNPYIGYQDSVVRSLLPKDFTIETVGQAASKNEKISIYLDTIARWLYQEQLIMNAK